MQEECLKIGNNLSKLSEETGNIHTHKNKAQVKYDFLPKKHFAHKHMKLPQMSVT